MAGEGAVGKEAGGKMAKLLTIGFAPVQHADDFEGVAKIPKPNSVVAATQSKLDGLHPLQLLHIAQPGGGVSG